MSTAPKWAYWRTRERLSVSEAAHLICNIEPADPAAAPIRVTHAIKALREAGVVKSKTFKNPPGADMLAIGLEQYIELADLLGVIAAGELAGFGRELQHAAKVQRAALLPLQQQREDALRGWLSKNDLPADLRGWSRERVRAALNKHAPQLFEDLKPATFEKFWKKQRACKLRR